MLDADTCLISCWCYCSFGPTVRTFSDPKIYCTDSVIDRVHKWYRETNDQNYMGYVIHVKRFLFPYNGITSRSIRITPLGQGG